MAHIEAGKNRQHISRCGSAACPVSGSPATRSGAYTFVGGGSLTASATRVCQGATISLTAHPHPAGATFPAGSPVWTVSPEDDNPGVVNPVTGPSTVFTANSNFTGTATITATCGNAARFTTVNVIGPAWGPWEKVSNPRFSRTNVTAGPAVCLSNTSSARFSFETVAGGKTRVDTNHCTSTVQSQTWSFAAKPVRWTAAHQCGTPSCWSTNGTGSDASFVGPWAGYYTVSFTVNGEDENGKVLDSASASTNVTVYGLTIAPADFTACAGCTNLTCAQRFDATGVPAGSRYNWNTGGGTILSNTADNSSIWVGFPNPNANQSVSVTYAEGLAGARPYI